MDEILKRNNLTYEKLTADEKETLNLMVAAVRQGDMPIPPRLFEYIKEMRKSVELELTAPNLDPSQDIFLKARLRNYMLLEDVLVSPQKAKEKLEAAVAGMASPLG